MNAVGFYLRLVSDKYPSSEDRAWDRVFSPDGPLAQRTQWGKETQNKLSYCLT